MDNEQKRVSEKVIPIGGKREREREKCRLVPVQTLMCELLTGEGHYQEIILQQ